MQVRRNCPTCGVLLVLWEWEDQIYCSRECYATSRTGRVHPNRQVPKICEICNVTYKVTPGRASSARFCSHKCAAVGQSQTAYDEPRSMSEAEIAWLAGLLDGEGSITMPKRQRGTNTTSYRVFIVNTHLPLIERIREIAGVGNILTCKRKNEYYKPLYTWAVYGWTAREIVRLLRPWLLVKAERADAVLEGRSFPRQERWDRLDASRLAQSR